MAISKKLIVKASVGLHARPAAEFVKLSQGFDGDVTIQKDDTSVDGKSMIGILKLAIKQGEEFELTLEGPSEEDYFSKFEELINKEG